MAAAGKKLWRTVPFFPYNSELSAAAATEANFKIFHAIEPTHSPSSFFLYPPCPACVRACIRPSLSGNGNQSRKKEEERPKFALSLSVSLTE